MSTEGINVQHGKLDTGSADVMTAATDIRSRLDLLADELKPLATDWTGAAKQAYDEAKANWDKAIDDMILLLRSASTNVSNSNSEYKSADNRGANRF